MVQPVPTPRLLFYIFNNSAYARTSSMQLDKFHPEAIEKIERMLNSRNIARVAGLEDMLQKALKDTYSYKVDPVYFHNIAALTDADHDYVDYDSIKLLLCGVMLHPRFRGVRDYWLDASDAQRESIKALVRVANETDHKWVYFSYVEKGASAPHYICLKSKELTDLVIDMPDRVDDILRVMKDRDTDDASVIRGVLEHCAISMSSGVL